MARRRRRVRRGRGWRATYWGRALRPEADEVGEQRELVVFEQQQQLLDRSRDLGVERSVPVALPQVASMSCGTSSSWPRASAFVVLHSDTRTAPNGKSAVGGPLQHREQLVDGGEVADGVLRAQQSLDRGHHHRRVAGAMAAS